MTSQISHRFNRQLWRPSIIDIEASGFGSASYPIEVGIVSHSGERYCSLIKPIDDWCHWDKSAEALHGISREVLVQYGKPVREVCLELNRTFDGAELYSDAWVHDKAWLTTLFFAARLEPTFRMSSIELILTEQQLELWDDAKQRVMDGIDGSRHRASTDALAIQETYVVSRSDALHVQQVNHQLSG